MQIGLQKITSKKQVLQIVILTVTFLGMGICTYHKRRMLNDTENYCRFMIEKYEQIVIHVNTINAAKLPWVRFGLWAVIFRPLKYPINDKNVRASLTPKFQSAK